jgi:hypothetical protein
MSIRPEAQAIVDDLTEEIKHCTKWAKHNYNWAQIIFILSVLSSSVAAILVGVGAQDWTAIGVPETVARLLLAILTGMPATFLLINNTMRFEEKAKWFWKKCRRCERYVRQLRDDPASNVAAIAEEFSALSEELENEWPAFGASPTQPKKSGI